MTRLRRRIFCILILSRPKAVSKNEGGFSRAAVASEPRPELVEGRGDVIGEA